MEEVVCQCGVVAHVQRIYVGKSLVWTIECPKCQIKVMAMDKRTAVRNFKK